MSEARELDIKGFFRAVRRRLYRQLLEVVGLWLLSLWPVVGIEYGIGWAFALLIPGWAAMRLAHGVDLRSNLAPAPPESPVVLSDTREE